MKRLLAILSLAGLILAAGNPAGAEELWGTGSPDWGSGASGPSPVVFQFDTTSGTTTTPFGFESSNWMWIAGLADSGEYLYAVHNTYNIDSGSSMDTHDFKIAKVNRYTGAVLSDASIAGYLGQTYSQANALEFHDGQLYAVENASSGSTLRGYAIHVLLDANGDVTGATVGAFIGSYPDCGLDYHDGLWYATSWGYTPSHKEGSIVYTSPDIMTTPFTQVGTGDSAVEGVGMIDGWEFDSAGNLFAVTWYPVPGSATAVYSVNPTTWTATSLYDLAPQLPASIVSLDGLSEIVSTCPSARYVDAAGDDFGGNNDCTSAAAPCKTIQYAVDQACDGDTINVAAGTYDAPIDIEGVAGLTINGADKTTVNIKPASTACFGLAYGCSRKTAVRVVNSTDIVLQNVTLDLDLVKGNQIYAIFYWDSTGTVDNNIVKNLSVPESAGGYYEIGSYFRAPGYSAGARAAITVSDNTLIDTGRVGILTHDYVDMTITGNTIYKTTADFGYAMEIGSASTAVVSGNTIYGYDTPAASDGSNSAGIYIENAFTWDVVSPISKPVTIAGNEISDSQWALYIGNTYDGYAGDVDIDLTVSGNNFHDNLDGAVVAADEDRSAGSSVTLSGSGNALSNNGGFGYLVYTFGDGDVTVGLSGETITGHATTGVHVQDFAAGTSTSSYALSVTLSEIAGNAGDGIYVGVPDATLASAALTCNRIAGNGNGILSANSGVSATSNSILGNATNGVDGAAIAAGTMNATANWWGCVSGPGSAGCDTVVGSVNTASATAFVPACVPCSADAQCDDGVFCSGHETCSGGSCTAPPGDPCTAGGECANACNEAAGNCNVTAGTACTDDGNVCTTNLCDGAGACAANPNTLPCNDSLYCNGSDTCAGGSCQHTGDPCAGGTECANACNEAVDNCLDVAGTACTDDGNVCTTNACDGSGTCAATNNTLPCNDAVFCNGADTCAGGSCTHAGDPCTGGSECANACNEAVDNCNDLAGTGCTDDGNPCTTNACNGGGLCAATNNTLPCDDSVVCTTGDTCSAGACAGADGQLAALCPWTLLVRGNPGGDHIKTGLQSLVEGDICASQLLLGASSLEDGSVVATDSAGTAVIKIGAAAEITADIVSGGGGAKGKPSAVKLPATNVTSLAAGSVTAKNDASGDYDLSGAHPLVAACGDARDSYASISAYLTALDSDLDGGRILLRANQTATLTAPIPGTLNVIDVEDVRGSTDTVLELDGGGSADTAVVLRIAENLQMRSDSSITLTGGLTPDRVLIYVKGHKCDFGNHFQGAGTLLCVAGRIQADYDTVWTGAWFAGKGVLNLGDRGALTYQPFLAF
ncbi:MAG: hypothetical protein HY899_16845 [Deltaproteobacteria bacterium]|nr:hypothetical protein [Deltaproteobacteria bacterium]